MRQIIVLSFFRYGWHFPEMGKIVTENVIINQ